MGSSNCTQTANCQNVRCRSPVASTSTSCIADYFPVLPGPSRDDDDEHMVATLREVFPSVNMEIIDEAVRDSLTTEDAVENILSQTKDKEGTVKSKVSIYIDFSK